MDGATPVNTGVVAWPSIDAAGVMVRRMQAKLHRWASEDSARRFGDLFNLVYDPAFLVNAWERVAGNDGARTAGVDGVTVAQVETRVGIGVFLGQIRDLLRSGEYRPSPVRQVKIPKGGGKLRTLGIPTVLDRVVQAACKAVLEPIFEADFLPCSYGFRPNRRAQDAIAEIHHFTSRPSNYHYVLEADIAACFDEIDHVAVMDRVRRRIKDKRLANLVKAFLKAGVLNDLGDREESLTGTPKVGFSRRYWPISRSRRWMSISPGNGTPRWVDPDQRRRRVRNGQGNWRLIRYADDFVLLVSGDRHHAEALREEVAAVFGPVGVTAGTGEDRCRAHRRGLRLPRFPHPTDAETRERTSATSTPRPLRKSVGKTRDKVRDKTHRIEHGTGSRRAPRQLNQGSCRGGRPTGHRVSRRTFGAIEQPHMAATRRVECPPANIPPDQPKAQLRRRFCDRVADRPQR